MMVNPELVSAILSGYGLPVMGVHGLPHWARVLENGLRLAEHTGANPNVVALFAVFHDSRRENESKDRGHGGRGAQLARELRSRYLSLTDKEFATLELACTHHTGGEASADETVRTCWDADRLDLWRVGVEPVNSLLLTRAARLPEIQSWAEQRSLSGHVPGFVIDSWLAEGDER